MTYYVHASRDRRRDEPGPGLQIRIFAGPFRDRCQAEAAAVAYAALGFSVSIEEGE